MRRILVVDDTEINRDLLCSILEDEYIVEQAGDGETALQKLQEFEGKLSAVLLDLYMPGMDGFAVISSMRDNACLDIIPVLVISSEHVAKIETQCLEMGVADFIHKPFDSMIVKRRVRNIIELFERKNELGRKVHEQELTLQKKDRIIQIQAGKLKEAELFDRLMLEYHFAIMEIETRLEVLNEEFSNKYKRNPFESIKSRLKSPESIYDKLIRKGYPVTVENIREHLSDVAGLRVVCSFPDDIYRLADLFTRQGDILLLQRKDYILHPKENGYRSLHLILSVPIFLSHEKKYVKTEIQFRTIAMEFWASLEHKMKYKQDIEQAEEIVSQLRDCADTIAMLDHKMQKIRDQIDESRHLPPEFP